MIIQVCGNIIDTQYIYNITKVETEFYETYDGYAVNGRFVVQFLNQKNIEINKNGFNNHKTMHTLEYKLEESQISKQLNDVRDQLICKWKANQLVVPKIEFDENNSIT